MSLLLLLGLLTAPHASPDDVCPDDVSIRQLKRNSAVLAQVLVAPDSDVGALDDAVVRTHALLGCIEDVPPHLVARAFLLLGATQLAQGDDFQAAPYVTAAAVLGGESTWDDSLGTDLRTRFFNALADERTRGVVWAPEFLLLGGYHLVGSKGPPPWLMPVGTFTFEWQDRSVPINVNDYELTIVLPRTFDEFDALVEGVTESDLEEPDYDSIIYYETRREQRRAEREQREDPVQDESTQQGGSDDPAEPQPDDPVDQEAFFDELAGFNGQGNPTGPDPQPDPEQPETTGGLAVGPHLGLGASWTVTGPAGKGAAVGDEPFGGPGLQAGVGLTLSLGRRLALRPELGFRTATTSADLDESHFSDEGWGSSIPVEPLNNRLLTGYARLPVLLRLGVVSAGLAPTWAMGSARVTALTDCGDDGETCIAPMHGTVMSAGGALLLGVRPGRSPVQPWLDLGVLHDGERAFLAGSIVLAWEGSP